MCVCEQTVRRLLPCALSSGLAHGPRRDSREMLRVSSLRRLLPAARIPDLSCGRLIGRWPSRLCTTQTDTRSAAEEPFAEPPPEHEPFAEASPVEDDDRPIRLPPEMRPPGDTSRKYVKVDEQGRAFAIGRRKQASARVWVWPVAEEQPAEVSINGMDIGRWFGGHWDYRVVLLTPFFVTDTAGKFNVKAQVRGGGLSGQAEAMRLAIATAMQGLDMRYRPVLKKAGLLKVDARRVERLKPGQPGARKKNAWVKR